MISEKNYTRAAFLKYLLQKTRNAIARTGRAQRMLNELLIDFSCTKKDALEYLNIPEEMYWDLVSRWPQFEEELFVNKNSIDEFYRSWSGEAARANICSNTFNQFVFDDAYHVARLYFQDARRILDFGCGTASISISHAIRQNPSCELVLAELQSDIHDFISYRIDKHRLPLAQIVDIQKLDGLPPFDFVICVDVLEHLENSAEVFTEQLLPKVAVGGYLMLRAPWRGQLTHIDEAPVNFYTQGARNALGRHFSEIYRIGVNDIDAVYRRVK